LEEFFDVVDAAGISKLASVKATSIWGRMMAGSWHGFLVSVSRKEKVTTRAGGSAKAEESPWRARSAAAERVRTASGPTPDARESETVVIRECVKRS